jgi:hypothetical protein
MEFLHISELDLKMLLFHIGLPEGQFPTALFMMKLADQQNRQHEKTNREFEQEFDAHMGDGM